MSGLIEYKNVKEIKTYKGVSTIRLINGDCMEIMRQLPDNYFSLAITDPPYGIGADAVQKKGADSGVKINGGGWKKYKETSWDLHIPKNEYFKELFRVSENHIIWGGNYFDINISGVVVWNKYENGTLPHGEMAKTNIKTFKIFNMSRADAYINNVDVKIHPTQKPVALYEWLLTNYAKSGDKILDTHGGSMSSAIACYNLNYDLDICELDKDYFEQAKKRFEKHKSQLRIDDMFGQE